MADMEMLRLIAAKTGLSLKYLAKDERLSIMLEQLHDIFPEVIFKGGTALNRVYLARSGVSRFSEDIDLNFIHDASLDENISRIKEGMAKINGFDISEPRMHYRTLRFDCGYVLESGERDQIKVEFYVNDIKSVKSSDILIKSPFVETHPTIFRTYSLEDLVAQKLIALHNRTEGKDIYDLFYALDLELNNESLSNALGYVLEFYKVDKDGFKDRLLSKLKEARANSFYIGNSANHCIPTGLRPDWKMFIDTLSQKIQRLI